MNLLPGLLERCFQRARSAPARPLPDAAPPGFATRVLASLRTPEARDWTLFLLPRAIGVAALLAAALLAWRGDGAFMGESELAGGFIASALEAQP